MTHKSVQYFAIFFAILFIIFGILQYNDPDPHLWIPIYGFAAIISIGIAFNRFNRFVLITAMVLYFIGAAYMWPSTYEGITLDMGYKTGIEEARESLGLFICGLVMAYFIVVSYKTRIL